MKLLDLVETGQNNITDTEEFKAWFGNSKVVTDDGTPRIVYHGTNSDFDEFGSSNNRGAMGDSVGFYFTDDPEFASQYGETGSVMAVYLRIQNPVIIDSVFVNKADVGKAIGLDMDQVYGSPDRAEFYWFLKNGGSYDGRDNARVGDAVVAAAKSHGHDGFIFKERLNRKAVTVYMVMSPNQIKSIHNNGRFGITSPNINEERVI